MGKKDKYLYGNSHGPGGGWAEFQCNVCGRVYTRNHGWKVWTPSFCESTGRNARLYRISSVREVEKLGECPLPGAVTDKPRPIAGVLRIMASGENCDGPPYDQMAQAADYITHLEGKVKALENSVAWHLPKS